MLPGDFLRFPAEIGKDLGRKGAMAERGLALIGGSIVS